MSIRQQPPAEPAAAAEPAAEVAVTLDGCRKEDANTVLTALNADFRSDRSPEDAPADAPDGSPIVWCATFDVSRPVGSASPGRLSEAVTLTAQGGYHAVDLLREGLADAFAVQVVGTASGDQEEEVRIRLETPAGV